MKIKTYDQFGSKKVCFLDLDLQENEPIPDVVRIFINGRYTHFLYADFKSTDEVFRLSNINGEKVE